MSQVPEAQNDFWRNHPVTAVQRTRCGVLLGFQDGKHRRCVAPLGHEGLHIDRTGSWWS